MRFDDRLTTVLNQPAVDDHGRAVQWRQLVELVARGRDEISPPLRDQALRRIAHDMGEIGDPVAAATARAVAGRDVPAELVALFAARGATVAAAMVSTAQLDGAGWTAVRSVAAPDVLPLIGALQPGSVPPAPAHATAPVQPHPAMPQLTAPAAPLVVADSAPRSDGLFRWECGPDGAIEWVEGAPRAALVGRDVSEPFAERFASRLPFSDEPLVMVADGAMGGEWRWSGTPAFASDSGRFVGYRGVARRDGPPPAEPAPALPDADDLRELIHELRTPLNAIIGFGEIIEGQYLGPAHRTYRDRAATIVAEARRLNEAVDNLDLSAKTRSGRLNGDATSSSRLVEQALHQAASEAAVHGVSLLIDPQSAEVELAVPAALAERLPSQFAGAAASAGLEGEALLVEIAAAGTSLTIAIDRPETLRDLDDVRLASGDDLSAATFHLRLIQGLATMVGGRLELAPDRLILRLPLAK